MSLETYLLLDKRVDEAEGDGIFARWEFGRELLAERVGKQLPKGRLDEVVEAIGKKRREVQYRIAFAEDYPTEKEVRDAITHFGSWYNVVHKRPAQSHNSGDSEWYTPLAYIGAARAVMGGIDLDPASTAVANEVVGATLIFTEEDDGLAHPWAGRVWMNPPYTQPFVGDFCAKLVQEFGDGNVSQAITLTNNATETKWFYSLAEVGSAICFPRGRVKFWHPEKESAPLQGQAVVYLGENVAAFRQAFAGFGFTVTL
jgi:ParB family chromosome partitioning protein